jgi:hypothetical protein
MVLDFFGKGATNISDSPTSNVTAPEPDDVDADIEQTYGDAADSQRRWRHVRIDERVQVVQQKPTLVRADARTVSQPVFGWRQRAGPGKDFDQDTPDERPQVKPAEQGPTVSQEGSEHHPQNEKKVQSQDQ